MIRRRFRLKCKRGHWKTIVQSGFRCRVCDTYLKKCPTPKIYVVKLERSNCDKN